MENWQVVFTTMYGGALAWLMITNVQQGKELAVIKSLVNELNSKLNLFLKTEMDTIKELINKK